MREGIFEQAEDEGWIKSEWYGGSLTPADFALHIHSNSIS